MDSPAQAANPSSDRARPRPALPADDLTQLGAVELLRRLHRREVSAAEVVEAHIRRIENVNPKLNALVTDTFDEAARTARRADERIGRGGSLPPLLGLPFTVKDAFPVAGVRFTAGLLRRKDHIAGEDAEIVRRMRAAGAILLGKTNVPDLSASVDTENLIFGQTHNPWNPQRSSGGSSGGEGALVAAGGSPLGIGSDFAGSVRIPAASCGVPGLKTSPGRIPLDGHVPETPVELSGWNTAGALARKVEDLNLALATLAGSARIPLESVPLHGRRLIVPEPLRGYPPSAENEAALEASLQVLRERGMVLQRGVFSLDQVPFEYAAWLYRFWLPSLLRQLGAGRPIRMLAEGKNHIAGRPTISRKVMALIATMSLTGPFLIASGRGRPARLASLKQEFGRAIGEEGVVVWYWSASGAPTTSASGLTGSSGYTTVFNALGVPAAVVPTGMGRGGLPLAVQVAAAPGRDETALAVCQAIEAALGGWRRPPI
ncbi:MAG TPA: amidase [Anaerolineales bacterium]|nr:amidase [Anaerolineales bacterium]